jgi:hypothetical protein
MNIGLSIGVSSTKHNVDSFSPKSFGTVTAWFDAKQQYAARGSSVTQINDYSGNAKHATQTTAANQAIIGPDGWFRFDGVNDYYNFGTVNANTVFAVARFDTVGKVNTVISKGYGLDINNLRKIVVSTQVQETEMTYRLLIIAASIQVLVYGLMKEIA